MSYKKLLWLGLLLLGFACLEGCTSLGSRSSFKSIPWSIRERQLQKITSWTMEGALSITHGKERELVRFKWEQQPDRYAISIFGPLNIGGIRIIGNTRGVEFWRTNKKCIRARTPEQLMTNQLGWQLPISNLRYWILSLPAKSKVHTQDFDQYEHLTQLSQSGWYIKYSEFTANSAGPQVDLPRVIELKNKKSEVAVKIKITKSRFKVFFGAVHVPGEI